MGGASAAVAGDVTWLVLCSGGADGVDGIGVASTGKAVPEKLVTAARGNCKTRV